MNIYQMELNDLKLSEYDRRYKEVMAITAREFKKKAGKQKNGGSGEGYNGLDVTKASMIEHKAKEPVPKDVHYEPCSVGY